MRISDWSSDVCSSDLKLLCRSCAGGGRCRVAVCLHKTVDTRLRRGDRVDHIRRSDAIDLEGVRRDAEAGVEVLGRDNIARAVLDITTNSAAVGGTRLGGLQVLDGGTVAIRSEEHTSALPSLMRISYAVFCL